MEPQESMIKRIQELSKIEDGWYDGYGKSFDKDYIEWVINLIKNNYQNYYPEAGIYPIPDEESSLQFEYDKLTDRYIIMIIYLNHKCKIYIFNNINNDDEEYNYDLNSDNLKIILDGLFYDTKHK